MSMSVKWAVPTLAAAMTVLGPIAAQAAPGERYGLVKVCSRYGKGCVSGPTRPGRFGDLEVRMPGGTWIGCKRDCRQTLREETVDFFETLNERAPDWR